MHVHMRMARVILEKPKRRAWRWSDSQGKSESWSWREAWRTHFHSTGPYVTLSLTNKLLLRPRATLLDCSFAPSLLVHLICPSKSAYLVLHKLPKVGLRSLGATWPLLWGAHPQPLILTPSVTSSSSSPLDSPCEDPPYFQSHPRWITPPSPMIQNTPRVPRPGALRAPTERRSPPPATATSRHPRHPASTTHRRLQKETRKL